jgi:hypothetical protein
MWNRNLPLMCPLFCLAWSGYVSTGCRGRKDARPDRPPSSAAIKSNRKCAMYSQRERRSNCTAWLLNDRLRIVRPSFSPRDSLKPEVTKLNRKKDVLASGGRTTGMEWKSPVARNIEPRTPAGLVILGGPNCSPGESVIHAAESRLMPPANVSDFESLRA